MTLIVAALLAESGCASAPPNDIYAADSVPFNPATRQRLIVKGNLGEGLIAPEIIVEYATALPVELALRNTKCDAWRNGLEGVVGSKKVEAHVTTVNKGGNIIGYVQVDKYIPGKCNWRLSEIRLKIVDADRQSYEQRLALGYVYSRARHYGVALPPDASPSISFYCSQRARLACFVQPQANAPEAYVTDDTQEIDFSGHLSN